MWTALYTYGFVYRTRLLKDGEVLDRTFERNHTHTHTFGLDFWPSKYFFVANPETKAGEARVELPDVYGASVKVATQVTPWFRPGLGGRSTRRLGVPNHQAACDPADRGRRKAGRSSGRRRPRRDDLPRGTKD